VAVVELASTTVQEPLQAMVAQVAVDLVDGRLDQTTVAYLVQAQQAKGLMVQPLVSHGIQVVAGEQGV
jgi:dTDP-4-dehydrorhamnose 3,5-epimerase-like enzyme